MFCGESWHPGSFFVSTFLDCGHVAGMSSAASVCASEHVSVTLAAELVRCHDPWKQSFK